MKQSDATFDATVARFRQLLTLNKSPENVVWLKPEDIFWGATQVVYVRVPIPSTNETIARRMFDEGMTRGRGLLMSTVCEMGASTCCYVWYPKCPEEEPQGLWPQDGSAKLSAGTGSARRRGKPVKSSVPWALLKLRHRRNQTMRGSLFR